MEPKPNTQSPHLPGLPTTVLGALDSFELGTGFWVRRWVVTLGEREPILTKEEGEHAISTRLNPKANIEDHAVLNTLT